MHWINLYGEDIFKVFLIIILSGIIGYNREKTGMLAGIRTHILVGLSAVVLQIIAVKISISSGFSGDPARLGGQMLTGIGFLGAGSIIKDSKNVRGLTTAASIFFVACIGLAVGFGFYVLSILVSLLGYAFLSDVFRLKKFIHRKKTNECTLQICYEPEKHIEVKQIISILSHMDIDLDTIDLHKEYGNTCIILKLKTDDEVSVTEIIAELSDLSYITTIKQI